MRRSLGATALVGLVAVVAAGCQAVTPPAAVTEQGQQISDLYNLVFAIAAVVFFLVEGLIVWSVIDRKSTRLNSSHSQQSRMPSSA